LVEELHRLRAGLLRLDRGVGQCHLGVTRSAG
jgi:hypothetical protein